MVTLYSKRRDLLTQRHGVTFQKIESSPSVRRITIKRTQQSKKKNKNKNKNNNNNNNNNTNNEKNKDNCIITVYSGKLRVISAVSQLLKQMQGAVLQEQLCSADCHHCNPSRRAAMDIQGEYIQP
jgi:hypothetical protein